MEGLELTCLARLRGALTQEYDGDLRAAITSSTFERIRVSCRALGRKHTIGREAGVDQQPSEHGCPLLRYRNDGKLDLIWVGASQYVRGLDGETAADREQQVVELSDGEVLGIGKHEIEENVGLQGHLLNIRVARPRLKREKPRCGRRRLIELQGREGEGKVDVTAPI